MAAAAPRSRISVLIPAYNARACVGACLDSVLSQAGVELQVVAVDDASDDGTAELLDARAAADPRLTVVHRAHNGGDGPTRCDGLAICDGDWLLCVDADDELEPGCLTQLAEAVAATDADILAFRYAELDVTTGAVTPMPSAFERGGFPRAGFCPADYPDNLYGAFYATLWDKLFRLSFIREHALDFQPLPRVGDVLFTLMALSQARRIELVDVQAYRYRINQRMSLTATGDRYPTAFYQAACALREGLGTAGLWLTFKVGYLNWLTENVNFNLANMTTYAGFKALYDVLHDGGLRHLGLDELSRERAVRPDLFDYCRNLQDWEERDFLFSCLKSQTRDAEAARHLRDAAARRLSDAQRAEGRLLAELRTLYGSLSFRMGRALTWLPRTLRDAVRRRC